jgi:hypothetical protein
MQDCQMEKLHLTNLQIELLKTFSFNLKENELVDIKKMLADYFAKKASDRMDDIWEEKHLSNDDMDKWLNEDKPN